MKRSVDRILTKPVGSLHRPEHLTALMMTKQRGEQVDALALQVEVQQAVAAVVAMQVTHRMDYVSDGDMSKPSFMTYPYERLSGFNGPEIDFMPPDLVEVREAKDAWYATAAPMPGVRQNTGPVAVINPQAVRVDVAHLQRAVAGVTRPEEVFLCSASPGAVGTGGTTYYQDEACFFQDIASAMRAEYQAVIEAGYVLQIDTPDIPIAGGYLPRDRELFLRVVSPRVEALHYAMKGLPAERMLVHACWGNWPGPHHNDLPLAWFLDLLLNLPCQGISIEATTRAHDADWHLFEQPRIAEWFRSGEKLLFVGLIDTKARAIESTQGIAERIALYAQLLGKENIIASTDCGFGTFLGRSTITPQIAEAKLTRLADGAELASQELWK